MPGHNFNAHAKITIIKEVLNKSLLKLKIRTLLEHREDFWILKLQTLSSRHYWIHLVAILILVTTHLFVHFILY